MGMKDQFQEKSERMKDQAKQKMDEAKEQHHNRGHAEDADKPQQRRPQRESEDRRQS